MARGTKVEDKKKEIAADDKPIPGFVRVDLLPEAMLVKAAVRRAKVLALTLIFVALFIIVAWRLYLQLQIQTAEDELLQAEATGAQLQAELARYSEIPPIYAAAEQGQEALTLAMGQEIRWSFLLNQLSFSTPEGVELGSVGGAVSETGTLETSPGEVLPLQPAEGTMTFTGTASGYERVAAWLDSLEGLKDYTYPFLANTAKESEGEEGGLAGVTWDSNANLSPNALSGRYGEALPTDPGAATPAQPAQPEGSAQ